jgi:hypothetical protein
MLVERIIGAFTFRRQVYAEVERDTTFTMAAWLLVAVVAFLNQLGTHASTRVLEWLGSTVVGTIWSVIAFAVAAYIMNWVGRALFRADVTFEELTRTLGLAYVWNVVGVIGILAGLSDALSHPHQHALPSAFVAHQERLEPRPVATSLSNWSGKYTRICTRPW